MKQKLFLLTLCFFLSIPFLFAQTPVPATKPGQSTTPVKKTSVTVKGQILDSLTNEALAFATVRIALASNPGKPVKMLSTDDVGKFQTTLENSGKFVMSIHYVGKSPGAIPFEVSESDKQIDLSKIYASDTHTLAEVVVSAVKPLVKVDLDKITYNTEDDPDSKTNNVLDMMRKVPMITLDGEDKIQLKGSSSFKIYLDGKPSNLISNNPTQVLKSMPANTVKSIEVITDPGAKYDAEGVTGVINIITNKQPMGGYTADLSGGASTRGDIYGGIYASLKYGKFGLTGNYNYSYYQSPSTNSDAYTEYYNTSDPKKYLTQDGKSKSNGNYQYGYAELSFEIDTLNLITGSFNRWGGGGTDTQDLGILAQDINKQNLYSYHQQGKNKSTWGSTGASLDYQRTFKKKDELLTASYRFSGSPNDSKYTTQFNNFINYTGDSIPIKESQDMQSNDASDAEHTFQLDYTTPLAKIHTIEGGVKYIIRLNESNSNHDLFDPTTQEWLPIPTSNDQFKYRYDIFAAYLGYNLRLKSYGFKTGLRLEDTNIDAEYPLNTKQNFKNDYFTLVPSATFTYKFKQVHNLRLGYNMRVQRPGIWYLNPYLNTSNPQAVSQGNPDLDVEKAHNMDLSYSMFKTKFSLNASLNYNFINNSIQRVTYLKQIPELDEREVAYSTYENIGKSKRTGFNTWLSWNPNTKLRFNFNGGVSYIDLKGTDSRGTTLKNDGFTGNLYGGVQYTFPKDFRISLNGGGSTPRISLQGKSSGYQFTSLGLNKAFLNKKLNIAIYGTNLFEKYRSYSNETRSINLYTKSNSQYVARSVSLRVSYQFGEMKQQIQKTRRGISNDDSKSGDGGGSQGGGGSSGGGQ